MKLQELNEQELKETNGGLLGLFNGPVVGGLALGNLLSLTVVENNDKVDVGLSLNLGALNLGGANGLGGLLGGLLGRL